jgi:DNA-binding transcriptional LysR family regulator
MSQRQRFDLNLLSVLDCLLREGSISRAARHLGVSQPTVSVGLNQLRKAFHDELFVRTGGGMVPTPRALELRDPVRRILVEIQTGVLCAGTFDPLTETRPYIVTMSDIGETFLLPRLVQTLAERAPHVNLQSVVIKPQQVEEALENGDVDLAVGYFPDLLRSSTMQQLLFTHGFACLARVGHPLVGETLTLETFLAADHVVVRAEGRSQEIFEDALAEKGLKRRCSLGIPHFMSVPFVVASSDLVATVPKAVAVSFSTLANIRVLDPPIQVPDFGVKQFWHRRFHHDPRIVWLRNILSDTYNGNWVTGARFLFNGKQPSVTTAASADRDSGVASSAE